MPINQPVAMIQGDFEFAGPSKVWTGRAVDRPTRANPRRFDAVAKGRRSRLWIESGDRRSERAAREPTPPGLSRSLTLRLQGSGIGGRIGTCFAD
jgi:hypothetical protein